MSIRKWLTILVVYCCLLLLAGCQESTSASSGKILAHFDTKIAYFKDVDPHFLGLSEEMSHICTVTLLDKKDPAHYEQLFRNLGEGILRVGGHGADLSVRSPDTNIQCPGYTVKYSDLVNDFFAFVHRIHWKVIWAVNFIKYDPQGAAREASLIANVAGDSLLAFAIGNEPDIFAKHGDRPATWTYSDYKSEWEANYQSIVQAVPTAKFVGSDSCCESQFYYQFTQDEHDKIIAATHHYYTGQENNKGIAYLLSKDVSDHLSQRLPQWLFTASQARVPLMITESNTFSQGGATGVSDTYAATLWAADYLCEASAFGIRTVAFHNSGTASYNVIDNNGVPTPLYYGLLFFHTLAQTPKSAIANVSLQTPLMVSAYEVMDGQKAARMMLMNRELKNDAEVEIRLDAPYKTIQLIRLTAPSIDAKSNITLGGRGISDQGTWSASKVESIEVNGASVSVTVPRGSAVEVSFE
jgi:Glycosyl hydrolase family 79 C-terminal beta domain